MAIEFCETIRAAGYMPGIYSNPAWFESYYKKAELIGKYDIWLAHWTENPDKPTKYNYGQRIWQWGHDKLGGAIPSQCFCFKKNFSVCYNIVFY